MPQHHSARLSKLPQRRAATNLFATAAASSAPSPADRIPRESRRTTLSTRQPALARVTMPGCLLLAIVLTCATNPRSHAQDHAAEQPQLAARTIILETGIALPTGDQLPLPPPMLARDADAGSIQQVLQKLSRGQMVDKFTRDSVYAPVHIDIEYVKDHAGQRIGHSIQSAFVAHIALAQLRDEALMTQLFGNPVVKPSTPQAASPNKQAGVGAGRDDERRSTIESTNADQASVTIVSADELMQFSLGIRLNEHQRLARVEIPLMNRVLLRGLMLIERYGDNDWSEIYWMMLQPPAPSLESDMDAADAVVLNQWSPLKANELGSLIEGEPRPYFGCAGYVAVRQIADQQVLVETRMLLYEPSDWFAGSNTLRAKLPVIMQDQARKFRRQLATP